MPEPGRPCCPLARAPHLGPGAEFSASGPEPACPFPTCPGNSTWLAWPVALAGLAGLAVGPRRAGRGRGVRGARRTWPGLPAGGGSPGAPACVLVTYARPSVVRVRSVRLSHVCAPRPHGPTRVSPCLVAVLPGRPALRGPGGTQRGASSSAHARHAAGLARAPRPRSGGAPVGVPRPPAPRGKPAAPLALHLRPWLSVSAVPMHLSSGGTLRHREGNGGAVPARPPRTPTSGVQGIRL